MCSAAADDGESDLAAAQVGRDAVRRTVRNHK